MINFANELTADGNNSILLDQASDPYYGNDERVREITFDEKGKSGERINSVGANRIPRHNWRAPQLPIFGDIFEFCDFGTQCKNTKLWFSLNKFIDKNKFMCPTTTINVEQLKCLLEKPEEQCQKQRRRSCSNLLSSSSQAAEFKSASIPLGVFVEVILDVFEIIVIAVIVCWKKRLD